MVAFNTPVWRYAMKQFKYVSAGNIEGWADLVADCVFRGLDIHQQLRSDTDFSALKDRLFYNWDTDEILENVHRWLDIVEQAGVSIKEYLMVETGMTRKSAPRTTDAFFQDECPVRELLTEHEHFATPLTLYPAGSTKAYIAQHEAWKEHQTLGAPDGSDRHRKGWPFWLPLRHYNDYSAEETEWVDRELQMAQKQCDRNQKRKERKIELHRQKQRVLMPGTWVKDV
ncbi:hypothetical protein FVEG_16918 [Fusarium verticillioides 7600]|uniref:Uncharacterized protein n=1 Tax=Gibberella moniliformis (strain M3125 / FGSC 7600) TaxID=334819 RepID=W7MKX7_GIBM7|nr:hypothetical protein FVEG_16918 [Fusarium verticillioides 7600]EWG52088.1 hypothetical protein FVEG_16918 [Fusarium verticillioides 7600]